MSILEEELADLKEDLEDAESVVGEQQGPLTGNDKTQVQAELDSGEDRIDKIQDPNQQPSLDPADVGDVLPGYNPQTLPKFASDCAKLATEAWAEESGQANPDQDYIGSRLKTIQALLPGYRDKAGIT